MARTGQQMRMRTAKAMARGTGSSNRTANSPRSGLGDKLRYQFDNSMSRGTPALIAWLTVATVLLILVFSIFVTVLGLRPDNADVPHGFPEVMGGKPWANVEGLQKENPMFYAKNFKTPTLITHGELDYRVPYGNGLELYGVLQAMNVPSRLVVFPDENHWVLKPQNAIYWHWEMQSWLSRYLGGKPVIEKPVFAAEAK